ncbi:hypothetical protein GCM10011611_48440 [Aliidongia dinghuensis]|uniref:Uncharacterized protein n=1 Tax=Aliidongia dinghuensis TaxID=1867774 RepID=A0A8J3E5Y4_9PROT|nr:hypothetical protein GCM10011611_48440 [Aliidongia dinghuensis]
MAKLKQRFALDRVVLVGDRGMLTSARIREDVRPAGFDWISCLRSGAIQELAAFLRRQAAQGAELNPLLTLQTLLGHADLATTAIYLRVVATDLSVIEASVDELYEALL